MEKVRPWCGQPSDRGRLRNRIDCERKLHSRGLEVKCDIINLQWKGDPMECGSYRGIKLLDHAVKVMARIFEHRVWQQIEVDDMQFGFMKGKGTTDAILL